LFKEHYDSMKPGPTPERVYAVIKIAEMLNTTKSEIVKAAMLYDPSDNTADIKKSIDVAIELGVLKEEEQKLKCSFSKEQLLNITSFRRSISNIIFSRSNSTFCRVTSWYIANDDKLSNIDNWDTLAAQAVTSGINSINDQDILGWRFWVSFLGIGYMHNKTIIPNMFVRMSDLLATSSFENGKRIPSSQFLEWLFTNAPECKPKKAEDNLSLTVSNALRSLHDLNYIVLENQRDAQNSKLYNIDAHPINMFSHIILKGGINNV
jgi:hypothetical protein